MATLTAHEQEEIARANSSGLPPVLFVHGLWLLSSSWGTWRQLFEANGYTTIAPGWPDDPDTVEEANQDPDVFAHKRLRQVTDHYIEAVDLLEMTPAVLGHSFGGLISEMLAGEGKSAATVAISPVAFRGILRLPLSSLQAASPVLANPFNVGRAVPLTFEQFQYAFGNAVDEEEAHDSSKPTPSPPQASHSSRRQPPISTRGQRIRSTPETPDRGPLLLISGEKDHTVPPAVVAAAYKRQQVNLGRTEYQEIPGRGHSLTIDHGWREVADIALAFIKQHR